MRFVLILFGLITFAACTPVEKTRGNFIQANETAKILPGASQAEILSTLGSPTAKAVFDDNVWYYVGEYTAQTAFNRPQATSRSVYVLTFDANGLLQTMEKQEGGAQDVAIAGEVTPTRGKTTTAGEQILGNIGRFNKQGMGGNTPKVPGTY